MLTRDEEMQIVLDRIAVSLTWVETWTETVKHEVNNLREILDAR